jgi:ketosteroid isomerase-like protein
LHFAAAPVYAHCLQQSHAQSLPDHLFYVAKRSASIWSKSSCDRYGYPGMAVCRIQAASFDFQMRSQAGHRVGFPEVTGQEDFRMSKTQRSMKNEDAIRNLVENWASAVRDRDIGGILSNHAPEILMFDVPQPLQSKDIDAYKETWDLFFSWARDPAVFEIKEMSITAGDEVAFVTAVMHCAGVEPVGGDTELDFRLTIGLQKVEDQWLITHEHHSIPAPG